MRVSAGRGIKPVGGQETQTTLQRDNQLMGGDEEGGRQVEPQAEHGGATVRLGDEGGTAKGGQRGTAGSVGTRRGNESFPRASEFVSYYVLDNLGEIQCTPVYINYSCRF